MMLSTDAHVRAVLAERHRDARITAQRAQAIAARRARRQAQYSSRWIRRVLISGH